MMPSVDVAVIGGGPAGTAAAIVLARGGAGVAVLDDPRSSSSECAETLPPSARPLLRDLGVWPAMLAGGHTPAYANESAWGSDLVARTDFTRDPNGHGWHVDRSALDSALQDAARCAGARMLAPARVESFARDRGGWRLAIRTAGSRQEMRAAWLLDATGRRGALGVRFGVPRVRDDALVAVVAMLAPRDGTVTADPDRVTFVESTADGWWFTAVATSGRRVVAYFTDFMEPSARAAASTEGFCALWASAPHLRERVPQADWVLGSRPRVRPAGSTRLTRCGGQGWLASGDALMAFDPISSQGLMTAAYTGVSAAQAILGSGADAAVEHHGERAGRLYDVYLGQRHACYLGEQRWRHRRFWRVRHADPVPAAAPCAAS